MFSPIFCTSASAARLDRVARRERARRAPRRRRAGRARRARAISLANARKSSLRGDEVGLAIDLDHRRRPCRPAATYAPMTPSAATRPAALLALAPLLMRSSSSAFARSPSASVSAFLHSIMPSPVRWRSSITMLAEISAMSFAPSVIRLDRGCSSARRDRCRHPCSRRVAGDATGARAPRFR